MGFAKITRDITDCKKAADVNVIYPLRLVWKLLAANTQST